MSGGHEDAERARDLGVPMSLILWLARVVVITAGTGDLRDAASCKTASQVKNGVARTFRETVVKCLVLLGFRRGVGGERKSSRLHHANASWGTGFRDGSVSWWHSVIIGGFGVDPE